MHPANVLMSLHDCCSSAWVGPLPPFGSRCPQAWVAALYWELLAASWFRVALGNPPLLLGSGKFGTPRERTHWAYVSSWEFADREFVDPPAFVEPPEPVDDGLALHAVSRAVTATAAQKHSVRARLCRSTWRICFTRGRLSRIWRAG